MKRTITFRIYSEKTLLILFSSISLAFALFYTFIPNTAHATSTNVIAAPQMLSGQDPVYPNSTSDTFAAPAAVSDVVSKGLAFKALLSSTQQATLEQPYTPALARRWSNLPCGSSCRNGIQFSTLTAEQLTAALQVIQAAAGTAANEGYDEFNQIRLADDVLRASGGGNNYSSGIYFISFLNTPTTTGAWMLQYGGHHYGANIAFNQGHVVGTTPLFYGIEPTSFTVNGTTYAPLAQEHDAMANMLASLTTTQLATARLTTTFSDVTMSPGESNGGNGTFPATKVGLAVSTLTDAQKLLVLEAIKPWVRDMDDTVAANLLSIYQRELDGTYIAYTGNGTSGNPSSFLNANTNYTRIDGPSVWIEFICQNGIVFRNQIHYHSVWRDHTRDYGADLSLTTPLDNAVFQFSSAAYSVSEDAGVATITVTRTGDTTGAATVGYRTSDDLSASVGCADTTTQPGAASNRCDYATSVGTVTFAAGATSATFTVSIIDDGRVEPSETFQVALYDASSGAALGRSAAVSITDNDTSATANPISANSFFVRQHYLDFLSREPEMNGFNAWVNVLNNCPDVNNTDPNSPSAQCDRIIVSSSFFRSAEFEIKGRFVFNFYRLAFDRLPEYSEIIPDMALVSGATPEELYARKAAFVSSFVTRTEFTSAYSSPSNAAFVAALMNRYGLSFVTTPDPTAPDGTTKVTLTTSELTDRLGATLTRAQVLRAIADSDQVDAAEFNRAFVAMQYYGYLRRTPETTGYNNWLTYLSANPTDYRTMVNGFMNSVEYKLRFGN